MSEFVLDCSVTMAWCFEDELVGYPRGVLDALADGEAHVPAIWPLEVANVLSIAERKKRITLAHSTAFLEELHSLSIDIDLEGVHRAWKDVLSLTRSFAITSYDAAYLELAMRLGRPLSTTDRRLRAVAKDVGVHIFT